MVRAGAWVAGLVLAAMPAMAQQMDFSKVEFQAVPVAENIYMLSGGQGGNIGVCVGKQDVLVIDDQFAPLTDKIMAAVRKLSDKPIKFLLNTHFHGDHTGGNENFAKAGVTIIAQDNTFARLSQEQKGALSGKTSPPQPKAAWPGLSLTLGAVSH